MQIELKWSKIQKTKVHTDAKHRGQEEKEELGTGAGRPAEVTIKDVCSTRVVSVAGDFDFGNLGLIKDQFSKFSVENEGKKAIIDLRETCFLDSEGIKELLILSQRIISQGGTVLIVSSKDHPTRVLKMTGVGSRIPIFPDMESAIERLNQAG